MKKVILLIQFVFYLSLGSAQNVYHGNVLLISQESVDNFGAWDYDEIDGSLLIRPYNQFDVTDISDLSALLPLKKVDNVEIFHNPHLKNLSGLDSLHTVRKSIDIWGNDSLQSIVGLEQIDQVFEDEFDLHLTGNDMLTSLDGFPAGIKKLYSITLLSNPNLTDITALENITSLADINLYNCPISSLQPLQNLHYLYNLDISYTQITDIAFPYVKGEHINARIQDNPLLKTISGFNQISDTAEINSSRIEIVNNPQLKSINGFKNIRHYSEIIIENNDNLLIINDLFDSTKTLEYQLKINHNPRLKSFGPFTGSFPKTTKNIEITHNDSLTSVVGLLGLTRVDGTWSTDGDINLRGNPLLTTLDGLDSLKYARYITFRFTNVSTLAALHNLDSIGFTFTIPNEIGDLQTLEGLENLSYIQHGFVAHNKNLKDISALMVSPTYSGHTFIISGCDSLDPSLSISNINAPDFIDIYNNPSIKEITGFSDIDSLHRGLIISNNKNLEKITCLKNLKYVKIGGDPSSIANTPNLTNISGLCPLFTEGTIDGTIEIHDNAPGFNSVQEIIDWCMTPTEDLPTYDAISVYPNPTSDAFQIEVPLDLIQVGMMVDLVDISGTSHFSVRLHDTVSRIPVGDLPPGLYFLRIVFDGRMVQVKKVVVER